MESADETAAKDAERLDEAEEKRIKRSAELVRTYSARIALADGMKELKEIPRPGRDIILDNVRLTVEQASRRCIELVHVEVLPDRNQNGNES